MLPENSLSTFSAPDKLIGARAKSVDLSLVDYEDGGVDISDASEGLQFQEWVGEYRDQKITLNAENGNTFDVVTIEPPSVLAEFSFTFDQNARPVVVYVIDDVSYLFFYDTLAEDYNTVQQQARMISPKVALDDKRSLNISNSDVILAYIYSNSLCYRQQRDRYLIEYVLSTELVANHKRVNRLVRFGMGKNWRLQFVLY